MNKFEVFVLILMLRYLFREKNISRVNQFSQYLETDKLQLY